MKRFLYFFMLLALLASPACAFEEAATYVFPYDGVRYAALEGETVLTQENLPDYADFLQSRGSTPEAVRASFAATQTVMEVYSDAGQISLSIGHSDEFYLDISVPRMDEARRAAFLNSFASSGLYEQTEWSEQNDEYLRVTHSAMYSGVPVYFLSYITLRHGRLYRFTATVAAREINAADDSAVLALIDRTEYLGQLATPAPTPSPTPAPTPTPTPAPTPGVAPVSGETEGITLLVDDLPAWTDQRDLTVTGVSMPDARVTLRINGKDAARATAGRDGAFKLRCRLDQEGALDVTVRATLNGQTDAEKTYAVVYEMPVLALSVTEPAGYVDTPAVTLRGTTQPGATVYIRGEGISTNVKAGNSGAFSLRLTHNKAGDFTYTLTAKLDGFHDGEMQYTITRVLSHAEQVAAFKNTLSTIDYDRLCASPADFAGKNVSLRGRIAAFSDHDGMPCLLLYTKNPGKGIWTQPVWVLCEEIFAFEEDDIITVLGTVEGTSLPFTGEEGDPGALPLVRMKFYND